MTTVLIPAIDVPGYQPGTWTIDVVHSDVSFTVRHMMVSKVRGTFRSFGGQIITAANPLESSVTADIALDSIDTGNSQRDNHVRSADFFDVVAHPTMSYRSTSVTTTAAGFEVAGELTLKGITRPVPLALELNGFTADPYGGTRAGFSATAQINRRDFGVDISLPMDGGGVVVGDKVTISLEIEAVLESAV